MVDVTPEGTVRFCSDCQKEVYFCQTDTELVSNIKLNRCVAIHNYHKINETLYDDSIMVGVMIDPTYT